MILVYLFVAFCALMFFVLAVGAIGSTINRFIDDVVAFFRARGLRKQAARLDAEAKQRIADHRARATAQGSTDPRVQRPA